MDKTTETLKYVDIDPKKAGKLAQKLHIKKDEIGLVRKFHVTEKDSIETNADERSLVAVVSTTDRDRDGQIVKIENADLTDYEKNPILMWAHRYSDPPIGRMMYHRRENGKLIMKFQFAKTEFAGQIYQLFQEKILRAFSIGFTHGKDDYDEKEKTFNRISILEVSAVPVPANQNALVMEAYKKGMITSPILHKDFGIEVETEETEPTLAELEQEEQQTLMEAVADATDKMMTEDLPQESKTEQTTEPLDAQQVREDKAIEDVKASNDKVEDAEEVPEVVTKPETTDNYHRLPVSSGHGDHTIKTITISAKKGIKALYCTDHKVVITYMFDTDKFTMEEAQAWIAEHSKAVDRYMETLEVKEVVEVVEETQETEEKVVEQVEEKETQAPDTEDEFEIELETEPIVVEPEQKADEARDVEIEVEAEPVVEDVEIEVETEDEDVRDVEIEVEDSSDSPSDTCKHTWKDVTISDGKYGLTYRCMDCGDEYFEPHETDDDKADIKEALTLLQAQVAELKEGRILSTKNRKLIGDVIESIEEALPRLKSLLQATEPVSRTEDAKDVEIEVDEPTEGTTVKDAEPEIELPKDALVAMYAKLLKKVEDAVSPEKLAKAAEKGAELAMAKLKGKVIVEDE